MSLQGDHVYKGYSSYYFADHCLKILGSDYFAQSSLKNFVNEQPFSTSSVLTVRHDEELNDQEGILVAKESGVSIYQRQSGCWNLISSDPRTPCLIESNSTYSTMQGVIATDSNEKANHLLDNFFQLLRIATESMFCSHGGLSVHASCVKLEDKAILFIAPSGTGKSTQAELWTRKFGAELLSGDRPHLRIMTEEIRAYGVPWDGKEQQFTQDSAPVAAIVEVRQAKENRIRTLSREQAFRLLMKQSFIPMWDDQAKFLAIQSIRVISNRVPIYRLFCNLQDDAASLVKDVLLQQTNDKIGGQEMDMRIKEGFILRNIVDEWIVMPKGTNIKNFEGAIVLNDVSAFIWQQLEKSISREDLLKSILDEFDVSEEVAEADFDEFLTRLRKIDILVE